jgi:hypothetical protein
MALPLPAYSHSLTPSLPCPLVTGGGMGGSASTARLFSPAHPSAPRRALHPSEHILIVRGLRARKLAAHLAHLRCTEVIFPILTSFTLLMLAVRRGPRLRASNEGLLRPRVPRARRALLIASRSPHILFLADTDSRNSCRPDSAATSQRRRGTSQSIIPTPLRSLLQS